MYGIPCLCDRFKKDKTKLSQLAIVKEFPNIFSELLPRLPLERKVEVYADILSRTFFISQPPYKITLAELARLKIQL